MVVDPVAEALKIDLERTRALAPKSLQPLAEVVWYLAWVWLPDGAEAFRDLDPDQWETSGHNARITLERGDVTRRDDLAVHPAFVDRVHGWQIGCAATWQRRGRDSQRRLERLTERYRAGLDTADQVEEAEAKMALSKLNLT